MQIKYSGKLFRILNADHSATIPTLKDGNMLAETSVDKAIALNKFFYSCFNHRHHQANSSLQYALNGNFSPDNCPAELLCSEERVFEIISELDVTKSAGMMESQPKCLNLLQLA